MISELLDRAIGDGVLAIACLDHEAQAVAIAGPLTGVYAAHLARGVNQRHSVERLFAGDVQEAELAGDRVAIAMIKRCLVLVVLLDPSASLDAVRALRERVAALLPADEAAPEKLDPN